jgi:hypothetical protein
MGSAIKPESTASDLFVPLTSVSIEARQYIGSADGFIAALPGLFQNAATKSHIAKRDFRPEIEYLSRAVRICSQITPAMAKSAVVVSPNFAVPANQLPEDPRELGDEFNVCSSGFHQIPTSGTINPQKDRTLYFSMGPRGRYWRDGKGLKVEVFFKALPGDPTAIDGARNLNNALELTANAYGIAFGTIDPSSGIEAAGEKTRDAPDTHLVGGPVRKSIGDDGFHFLTSLPATQRTFDGGVARFQTMLPDYFRRAASAAGLNPQGYEEELAYIQNVVRNCAAATGARARAGMLAGCQYGMRPVPAPSGVKHRGLLFHCTVPMAGSGELYMEVSVAFAPLQGEQQGPWADFGIVSGKVGVR